MKDPDLTLGDRAELAYLASRDEHGLLPRRAPVPRGLSRQDEHLVAFLIGIGAGLFIVLLLVILFLVANQAGTPAVLTGVSR